MFLLLALWDGSLTGLSRHVVGKPKLTIWRCLMSKFWPTAQLWPQPTVVIERVKTPPGDPSPWPLDHPQLPGLPAEAPDVLGRDKLFPLGLSRFLAHRTSGQK